MLKKVANNTLMYHAIGITGLFGYFIGTVPANTVMGFVIEYYGWYTSFILLVEAVFFACFFLALAWNPKIKHAQRF